MKRSGKIVIIVANIDRALTQSIIDGFGERSNQVRSLDGEILSFRLSEGQPIDADTDGVDILLVVNSSIALDHPARFREWLDRQAKEHNCKITLLAWTSNEDWAKEVRADRIIAAKSSSDVEVLKQAIREFLIPEDVPDGK